MGGRNYTIYQLTVSNSTATDPGTLYFSLDGVLTAADRARLVLHVDDSGDTFAFSAAMEVAFATQWTGTDLDWSSETTVTLRLRLTPQAPDAPTNLMAEADGSTRIALSWDAPADDGGSAITGYRIEVSDDGGSNWSELEADTGDDGTNYTHRGFRRATRGTTGFRRSTRRAGPTPPLSPTRRPRRPGPARLTPPPATSGAAW